MHGNTEATNPLTKESNLSTDPLPTDSEPIKMHILVSSHMDPGWTFTFEELYQGVDHQGGACVKSIMNNVFDALGKDKNRKYSMAEVSYFERWWQDQNEERRAKFREYLKNGQFEFINGGWTANDEAVAYYEDILDNFVIGQRWLVDNFGLDASFGWQVDSFGNSSTHAALMAQGGYTGHFFSRAVEIDRASRRKDKRLQFNWKMDSPRGESVFTQMLYVLYADIMFLKATERTMFHFGRLSVEQCEKVAQYIRLQSTAFKTKNVLFLVCDDFHLTKDAEKDYDGIEAMGRYFDEHPELGIKTRYSTLEEYYNEFKKDFKESKQSLPVQYEDFFPYVDNKWTCWTGYFTSKSMFKLMIREHSVYYNAVKLAFAKILLSVDKGNKDLDYNALHRRVNAALDALEGPMGIAQHHDAVTGTMKDRVRYDYERMLHEGRDALDPVLHELLAESLKGKLGANARDSGVKYDWFYRDDRYEKILGDEENVALVVFNPGRTRRFLLKVKIPEARKGYKVVDENDKEIEVDLVPHSKGESDNLFVYFVDEVPLYSFKTYRLVSLEDKKPIELTSLGEKDITLELGEGRVLHVSKDLIGFKYDQQNKDGSVLSNSFDLDYKYYESSILVKGGKNPSGAYIFAPRSQERFVFSPVISGRLYRGKDISMIQIFREHVRTDIKITHNAGFEGIEIESYLEPVTSYENGKEVALIVRSNDIKNKEGIFYTDANGYYMQRGKINHKDDYQMFLENGVETNYYPITSHVYIEDDESKQRLSVVTDRGQGVTSYHIGELEIMLHRVCVRDDAKGVEEALQEKDPKTGEMIRVITRQILSFSSEKHGVEDKRRSLQYDYDRPLQLWFYLKADIRGNEGVSANNDKKIEGDVVPELVKVYVRSYKVGEYVVRLHNLSEDKAEKIELYDKESGVSRLLRQIGDGRDVKVESVEELAWTTTRLKSQLKGNELDENPKEVKYEDGEKCSSVQLLPMEIRTFNVVVK